LHRALARLPLDFAGVWVGRHFAFERRAFHPVLLAGYMLLVLLEAP
jgi:hypothetical protein